MILRFPVLLVLLCLSLESFGQLPAITIKKRKGTVYLTVGYTRSWYSRSDIHFKGNDYDFTVNDAFAEDRPYIKNIEEWDVAVPQFYGRIGYFFKNESIIGIEAGFDHIQYVMRSNQRLRIQGVIQDSIVDHDTLVTDDLAHLEHTNGASLIMLSFVKGFPLFTASNENHFVVAMLKPGAGILVPRTNVGVLGKRKNNEFQVAGYVAGLDVSLRYIIARHFFIETSGKGCFANYTNIKTVGNDRANHSFEILEWLASIGCQFSF